MQNPTSATRIPLAARCRRPCRGRGGPGVSGHRAPGGAVFAGRRGCSETVADLQPCWVSPATPSAPVPMAPRHWPQAVHQEGNNIFLGSRPVQPPGRRTPVVGLPASAFPSRGLSASWQEHPAPLCILEVTLPVNRVPNFHEIKLTLYFML